MIYALCPMDSIALAKVLLSLPCSHSLFFIFNEHDAGNITSLDDHVCNEHKHCLRIVRTHVSVRYDFSCMPSHPVQDFGSSGSIVQRNDRIWTKKYLPISPRQHCIVFTQNADDGSNCLEPRDQ